LPQGGRIGWLRLNPLSRIELKHKLSRRKWPASLFAIPVHLGEKSHLIGHPEIGPSRPKRIEIAESRPLGEFPRAHSLLELAHRAAADRQG